MARHLLGAAVATAMGVGVVLVAVGTVAAQSPSPGASAAAPSPIGEQTTDVLGPDLTLELGEGWLERPRIAGPILVYEHTAFPGGVLTITRFDGDAYADSCDPTSLTTVEPSAARFIEVIAGNPWLEAEASEPLEVSGRDGLSIDVATPLFAPTECRLPLLLLWAVPMENGEFIQIGGQASRFIAVDVGPDTIVIAIETVPGVAFDPFADAAMEVVGSMAFESS